MRSPNEALGIMHVATFEEVAVTTAQDLFTIYLDAVACGVARLHSVSISQSSDAGNTEMEMLDILYHRVSTPGSGGTTDDAKLLEAGSTSAIDVDFNNTIQATTGTVLRRESFNVLLGYEWSPSLDEQIWIYDGSPQYLVISLETAPADSITLSGTVVIEFIGGIYPGG